METSSLQRRTSSRSAASYIVRPNLYVLAALAVVLIATLGIAQVPFQPGIEREDQSRHVTFDAVLGYSYQLYTSTDLETWTAVDPTFYGFGEEYSVHVHTDPPPGEPPPPPGGQPVDPPPRFEPLLTEFGPIVTDSTLLSFTGDNDQPYQVLVPEVFTALDVCGGYLDTYSGYQFSWLRMTGPWLPAYSDLPELSELPQAEQDKVQAFIDARSAIEQSGSSTPGGGVTQFDPGEARYWRVEKSEVDSDSDGLMDWLEFDLGLSAFNADSDFDLVSDGAEMAAGSDPLNAQSGPPPVVSLRVAEKVMWAGGVWVENIICVEEDCHWEDDGNGGEEYVCYCGNRLIDYDGSVEGELWLNGDLGWEYPVEFFTFATEAEVIPFVQPVVSNGKAAFNTSAIPAAPLSEQFSPSGAITASTWEATDATWVNAEARRVWLETDHIAHQGVSRTWLVVHESKSGSGGTWTVEDVATVTLTVPPGQTTSTTQTYTPSGTLPSQVTVSAGAATLHPQITPGLDRKVSLQPVEFETFPKDEFGEIGGNRSPNWKAHKLSFNTKQDEKDHYDPYVKCVCHVFENANIDLINYLKGSDDPNMRELFEDHLKWRSNGIDLIGHELNFFLAPEEDEIRQFNIQVLGPDGTSVADRLIVTVVPQSTKDNFDAWYTAEQADTAWLQELQNLYSEIELEQEIEFDPFTGQPIPQGLLRPDRNCSPNRTWERPGSYDSFYHPNAYYEARSHETPGGHGHQACYDAQGVLIRETVSAGSADRSHKNNLIGENSHTNRDVLPFIWAAQLDGNPVEGTAFPPNLNFTAPMLHEGAFLGKYVEVRPTIANTKPELLPGSCP